MRAYFIQFQFTVGRPPTAQEGTGAWCIQREKAICGPDDLNEITESIIREFREQNKVPISAPMRLQITGWIRFEEELIIH